MSGEEEIKKSASEDPIDVLGVKFAPVRIPFERRWQTLAVFIYMSLFLFMGLFTTSLLIFLLFTPFFFVPILYVTWMFYDWNIGNTGGRLEKNCWVRKWFIWKHQAKYFPISLIKTCELDPEKSYLFGCHPHGILCFGAFSSFATDACGVREIFPDHFTRMLTLNEQFHLPGSRELVAGTGTVAATKKGMGTVLKIPKGLITILIVGGASEALNYATDEISLVLNKRKGFIKLALSFGRDLVPVFAFGENFIYGQAPNPEGSRLRRFQNWFEKKFKFSPPIFYGRGVFQYNWGFVPFRKPINVVVGTPIKVDKIEDPTSEDIEKLHGQYVNSLKKLYEEYNPKYGDPSVRLVIN